MERLKVFLLGVLITTIFFLLIGARSNPPPEIGRYQIAAMGTENNPAKYGVYVVDTTTGEVRPVVWSGTERFGESFNRLK